MFLRLLYCLLSNLKHSGSFPSEQIKTKFILFDGFHMLLGPPLLRFEPHAVSNVVFDSVEAAVAVLTKWLLSLCFCCYSTESMIGFGFVLLTTTAFATYLHPLVAKPDSLITLTPGVLLRTFLEFRCQQGFRRL